MKKSKFNEEWIIGILRELAERLEEFHRRFAVETAPPKSQR